MDFAEILAKKLQEGDGGRIEDYDQYAEYDKLDADNATREDLMNLINALEEEDYNEVADIILEYLEDTYYYEDDEDTELDESRTIRVTKHTDRKKLKKAKRKRRQPKEKAKRRKKSKRREKKRCGPGMAPNNDGRGCHRTKKTVGKKKRAAR